MSSEDCLPLEPGLCFFYENQSEFERKEIPVEKQVALAWQAGRQAGRCELREKVVKVFKPERGVWA